MDIFVDTLYNAYCSYIEDHFLQVSKNLITRKQASLLYWNVVLAGYEEVVVLTEYWKSEQGSKHSFFLLEYASTIYEEIHWCFLKWILLKFNLFIIILWHMIKNIISTFQWCTSARLQTVVFHIGHCKKMWIIVDKYVLKRNVYTLKKNFITV